MAKLFIAGKACVITSEAKLADLKLLEKFNPEALKLKDEEGDVLFKVGTTAGEGSISKYGVSFDGAARDGSGKATVTLFLEEIGEGDLKEKIADEFGAALRSLKEVEAGIPAAVAAVQADRAAIIADIEVQ